MRKAIKHWLLLVYLATSCVQERNQVEEIDEHFINFLTQEINFDMKSKGKWGIVILQGSDCACKEANHLFINSLIRKFKNINFVIIAKNDIENRIKTTITMRSNISIYFEDNDQLLEKHGNLFVGDKIFIFEDGSFTQTLNIEKDNYEVIEDSFM
ncbi:hypothetical protein [Thermoflexibacter ruber]|uniref:Lipoprotein n=1 Tax=Thermoflexibacter ruber TaxID=1003 RepID=A0A1I2FYB3_9BACT|nr:hypothetical protein [Thermoflexibacter ruber]SFF09401.1 hypothetical protein SAMN04488541_101597 [Thermoflexibacter ruber]